MAPDAADRFSGGMRLMINQVWDLAAPVVALPKHLLVQWRKHPDIMGGCCVNAPRKEMTEQGELVRGLGVRLSLAALACRGSCNWAG